MSEDYEAGRVVGYAEGYPDSLAQQPQVAHPVTVPSTAATSAFGYWPLTVREVANPNVWGVGGVVVGPLCICGVMSGGVRDPRPGCPVHPGGRA